MTTQHFSKEKIKQFFELPFFELMQKAHQCHAKHHRKHVVQQSALLSIKTGGCPEDCAYCPQSAHYKTSVKRTVLMKTEKVVEAAKSAKQRGATRFCLGAAWKYPPKKEFPIVLEQIYAVKGLGLEACATLGSLNKEQAEALKSAGLDYYNHNLDTSASHYQSIITTRSYQERLDTLNAAHQAGIKLCCGGILGLGETREDRIAFLHTLQQLPEPPNSIPINHLIPSEGTPLANNSAIDPFEFIRMIATTRLLFPSSMIRLSAGRTSMEDTYQAWCFFAGANSIFIGDVLLTQENPDWTSDQFLLERLNLNPAHT